MLFLVDEPSILAESVYQNAQNFIPERWYLYPKMIKERSAFAPFTTGT